MKKIISFVIIAMSFLLLPINTQAAGMTTGMSGGGTIAQNAEFQIRISVSSGEGVYGFMAGLNYDHNLLELINTEGVNGFSAMTGTNIVADSARPLTAGDIVVLTFRAKPNLAAGSQAVISLTNVKGSVGSGPTDVNSNNVSLIVQVAVPKSGNNNLSNLMVNGKTVNNFSSNNTYYSLGTIDDNQINIDAVKEDGKAYIEGTGTKQLQYGSNSFTIRVVAENGSVKTYTIQVTKKDNRSNNNYLKELSASIGDISFDKNNSNYTINVKNNITEIEIFGNVEDSKSTIVGLGKQSLKEGLNAFIITVIAENGSTRTYQVNVVRKLSGNAVLSNNNNLASLKINGITITLTDKLTYQFTVDNKTTNLIIDAIAEDALANININNVELKVGYNTITINVTASNGEVKVYTIHVERKDNIPYLDYNNLDFKEDIYRVVVDHRLTNDILKKMKESNKTFYFEVRDTNGNKKAVISLKGKYIPKTNTEFLQMINLEIGYDNFDKNNTITFKLSESSNGSYSVHVGDKFSNNKEIILYQMKNGKLIKITTREVSNGFITIPNMEKGTYLISDTKIPFAINFSYIIIGLETIGLAIITYLFIEEKKKHPIVATKKRKATVKKNNK